MTDGTILIEKLLCYAKENLELNESDVCVKRNQLLRLFNLKTTALPNVTETSYSSLKEELLDFLKQNSICQEGEYNAFIGFVFGILMPLPSFINKKFRTLREKFGARYACDYLYNLSLNGGSLFGLDFSKYATSYYKGDAIDIYAVKDFYKETLTDGAYPKCALCAEAEGFFGNDDFYGGASRSVTLDLNGREWKMRYIRSCTRPQESSVSFSEHSSSPTVQDIVMSMFDYIEYLPDYSAEMVFSEGNFLTPHVNFRGGVSIPQNLSKNLLTASSDLYPDVEISLYNGELSIIKLKSFNRNTLENLVIDLTDKWLNYSDLTVGIFGKGIDGVFHNACALSVEYSQDNRYSCNLVLTCEKVGPKNEEDSVFSKISFYPACFGRVFYDLSSATEMLCAVLTKKIPLDDSLFADDKPLYGYKNILEGLIKENGYFKDAQKAEVAVKRAVYTQVKDSLCKKSAFAEGDEGARAFRRFLATANVK